jgi:hypothetical protein
MESLLDKTVDIHTIDEALALLKSKINTFSNIEKAYQFALKAHDGQYRKSSEPYIVHPILVASIVAEISHDKEMVQAALLHDVVEDTDCTIDDIIKEFGKNVANLVEGLTKIVELRDQKLIVSDSSKKLSASALSFRKLLIASIKDVRVIVIKLCDRIHNMQTLQKFGGVGHVGGGFEGLVQAGKAFTHHHVAGGAGAVHLLGPEALLFVGIAREVLAAAVGPVLHRQVVEEVDDELEGLGQRDHRYPDPESQLATDVGEQLTLDVIPILLRL